MTTLNFTDQTDDGLNFTNITVIETGSGAYNSFVADYDPDNDGQSPANLASPLVAGLRWGSFVAGVDAGGALTITIEYNVTSATAITGITGLALNAFVGSNSLAVASLTVVERATDSSNNVIGQSTLTLADHVDPPPEILQLDDLTFNDFYHTVHIKTEITLSSTLSSISFSALNQTYTTAPVPANASLGDRLWLDKNGNGQQDSGENGVGGVTVKLIGAGADNAFNTGDDVVLATTTTDANGGYLFTNLNAGSYQVQFVAPTGYTITSQNVGNDASDSDANPATGKSQAVTLAAGEANYTVDAGLFTSCKTSTNTCTLDSSWKDLCFTGTGGFCGTGNGLDNCITGGTSNDTLDGSTGADTMIGGTGNDTYFVDNAGDVVTENSGAGTDTVKTSLAAYTLGSNVENLTYTGAGSFSGTGNSLNNSMTGGAAADALAGAGGADTLTGGAGADSLTGGSGADRFVFSAADLATIDEIMDFSHAQGDKIDLSAIDANSSLSGDQAFAFIGTGAFTGVKGQLHYSGSGPLILSGDINGDGVADFSMKVDTSIGLVAGDFVL